MLLLDLVKISLDIGLDGCTFRDFSVFSRDGGVRCHRRSSFSSWFLELVILRRR